jgi:integrase
MLVRRLAGDFVSPARPQASCQGNRFTVEAHGLGAYMRKLLTDTIARSVAPPETGRVEMNDLRCTGLAFRVTAAGARSWCFRFRDPRSGRSTRSTIGTYPDISLAVARERADELRRSVARGENPVEAKRQERREAANKTFEALANRYLQEHARRFKRSAGEDERNLRLHVLPSWSSRQYDAIARRDVIALVEDLVASGRGPLANKVQALVSSIYSFAVDADLVTTNPCARLRKRGIERKGTRVLSDAEIRLFWPYIILPPVSHRVGLALRFALLTGMRASEVAGLTRSETEHLDDAERAAAIIPADRSKNGCIHYVPLSGMARETLKEILLLIGEDAPNLFPSPVGRGSITGHALAVAMRRMRDKLPGDTEATKTWHEDPPSPHDLRRTVATRLAALGVPHEDVSRVLNHKPQGVTATHYDQYDRAREKRAALNLWAQTLTHILDQSASAAMVPMRHQRNLNAFSGNWA